MSTPDDLRFVLGHPMPNEDHAALLSSYHLLREQAKDVSTVSVRSSPPTSVFESWEVTRAAFMARMTSTLAHLGYLAPSYSRLDGFALARTLVDHAITFAWLSGDPPGRLPAFIRASFESLIRKDDAAIERGDPLLDEATREGFETYIDAHKEDAQPRLPRRAELANASWGERIKTALPDSLQFVDFTGLYHNVYGNYATYDHPTTLGLHVFVHVGGTPSTTTVTGEPERDRKEDLRPYWIAMFAFAEALVVSHRCCPRWAGLLERLSWRALARLARNEPVDPNDPTSWRGRESHAQIVLRRHGITRPPASRLTAHAQHALIDGQARADREAGLDWTALPAPGLDERLQRVHTGLPISLDEPSVFAFREDQRRALCTRLELVPGQADDLSRWVLEHPGEFEASDLRCWRIASATWLRVAEEQLPPIERVERPVGVFVVPAGRDGWQLVPVLSLDAIRLIAELGGRLDRDLCAATLPAAAAAALLERVNVHALHAGSKECLDSAVRPSAELTQALGSPLNPGVPRDKRDRWGRLLVTRRAHTTNGSRELAEVGLRVLTFPARGFGRRRLGAVPLDQRSAQPSAVMELGEAVQSAIERELPLLLSTEAAGLLKDMVRVGRMKGRPGVVTITTADGVSASTRRVVAEQAIAELRALKDAGASVTLDAGARQVVRMTLARPLADDPILLGRHREMAALKVVGSGVDASATGTGKTISTGRALAHRAATTRRLRAMVIAEGRLLGQWRDELTFGAPGRGLPPLAPNVEITIIDDHQSVAGQLRAFDRALGDRAGVALVSNGLLDRYPAELQTIRWHLLVADEALRYVNPATEAHQALTQVRFGAAADCWLLTATPRGKTAEHLDVLVGLAVGDRAMIRERLNTREAGDLMDEIHAHRLRVNYGPHLVRVTRQDMPAWMPQVRPAEPLALEPDPALAELLDAIRRGGREAYQRLLEVLRELKTLEPGGQLHKDALTELARVQGVVLGNVGVFVDASVDPETLLHSKAALATALARHGLVHEAMRGGGDGLPLLRGITAQTIAGVTGEEQVIVFAERVRCLRQVAQTLRERYGVEGHVGDGSLPRAEFEALKQRFGAGEFPVLCLSQVGHEGHNLQNASVLVHLDIPWLQTGLEQRVGRAARPGARRGWVQTYIPYIKGGGIEHVVSVLAGRAAEHHQILDSFEGVKAADSTVATQLGQITSQVAAAKSDAGFAATAARLRVAASVFGA